MKAEPGCTCQRLKSRRKTHLASCKLAKLAERKAQELVIAPIPGVMEPRPGAYHEMLRFVSEQVRPAGAILFIVNGVHGTGWECMGSPQVIADLPRLFRKVADEIEGTAHIKKISGGPR